MIDWGTIAFVVLAGVVASQIAYLIGTVLAAALCRLPMATISLGVGPQLLGLRVATTKLRLGAIPFASYVQFGDADQPSAFEHAPWYQKLFCAVLGAAAMVAAAAVVNGAAALEHALAAFSVIGQMIAAPYTAMDFTGALHAAIAERGALGAIAQVAAFVGGLQFLPLTFLAGGAALLYLAEGLSGRRLPQGLVEWLNRFSLVAAFILIVMAIAAIAL